MNENSGTAVGKIMKEALRRSGGKPLTLLVGEGSTTDDDPIRLQVSTGHGWCMEIPREAVHYSSAIDDKQIRILVERDAELVVTLRDSVRAGDLVGGDPGPGVSEMMNLQKLIRGWGAAGLKLISNTAECISKRKEFDELVEVTGTLTDEPKDAQLKHWFETELLRQYADMLSNCPSWIHP